MADVLEMHRKHAESSSQQDGRLVGDRSGQYGVSDERRAQLLQMEHDAGIQHDATDEAVSQRQDAEEEQSAALATDAPAARPGDRH